ncbi:ABC transporter G family member 22 [Durusdinium trenchii]|uniref:ABC transporter G family member 22 n=1 Tax=Durusdinium trenchii TaxID=1381693 RepID=A0ABP0MGH9_9DINO
MAGLDGYKKKVREAMEADGVHPNFLQDAHWVQLWRKHFEGSALLDPEVPFERPMEETFKDSNLRVLQWNLLAEGLVPEGFMMPLVSKAHVQRSDQFLQTLLQTGEPEDLRTAAKLSSQGYRSFVWRQGEDGSDQIHWEEFARMACNMVLAMKGLPPSQKEERGLDLKKRYNPDQEGPNSGQLTVNEKAVVGPEHRLLRVVWFVALLQPDVICFQEVDNFAFLAHELQKLGYACSSVGAKDYVPLKDRTGSYGERLAQSEWSFAPKSGVKRGKSTARHFLEKRVKDGGHKATIDGHQWPIDDDGQAIFWRNDRFEIVGEPEFLVLPGDADIDAFLDGTSEEPGCTQSDQGAVRVLLQFKDLDERLHRQQFYVSTTHLSSGTDQEVHRIQQLHHLGSTWARSGLPEIWSMDANTEVDFEDPDMTCSSVPIPEDANALQSFMQKNDLRSVWDSFYSSKGDIWDPPVSVWKMRGSASAQPKKVGEDMYQLIDHIFYDGRHLFGQGEQALRLREKKTDDPADRDWLALMPNELLPSDHLPIVWDFHLNVNSPRWEPTVLVSCAKQLFQQLRSLLPGADPNLDEIESLFAPLYLGGLHGRRDSSPDVALSVFHVLKKISVEAKATLKYELTDNVSKLELFRERIIKATGRHQSKATYESSLVQALLFSAASIVAGQGGLFSDQWSTIALAAMRCVLRTLTAVPCLDPSFVEVMSEGQLWALLAQMTSIITPNCPYIVKAFDQNGIVTSQDMDCLLVEIGEQLNCRRTPCAPALCVLRCINWRKCATGTHVAAAVKMLMQAIEAGKIPFLEQHLFGPTDRMEEMQAVPSAVSVVSTIRLLRANSATPQPPLPPEMQHKQTFDQSAAISALASLANSGNLDSGGGLALLLESLQRQMALAQGTSTPERQARALHRPPPWVVASYVRRTVVSALEKTEPLEALVVSAQKLHVSEQEAKKRARLNPVEELIQALVDFPQDGPQSQAHTFGRILRLLVKIADRCGPKALLAPMVARNGIDRIRDVLRCLALLSEEDLQRWKTHLHLNRFLDLLLSVDVSSDSLLLALQQRVEEAIKEKEFKELLMQRPSRDDASPKSYDLNKILAEIDTFDFVKKLQ